MNVQEIVKEYLKDNGYDGLYSRSCGCRIDDLMPCSSGETWNCKPGYLTYEHDQGGDFWIGPDKRLKKIHKITTENGKWWIVCPDKGEMLVFERIEFCPWCGKEFRKEVR